jgi:hypothetical protein
MENVQLPRKSPIHSWEFVDMYLVWIALNNYVILIKLKTPYQSLATTEFGLFYALSKSFQGFGFATATKPTKTHDSDYGTYRSSASA